MASIDEDPAGDRLIIADVALEDAWITIPAEQAISLRTVR